MSDLYYIPPCTSIKSKYSTDAWILAECTQCGLVYLQNPPEYSQFEELYAYEKTHEIEVARRKRKEPVLYALSSFIKSLKLRFLKRDKLYRMAKHL